MRHIWLFEDFSASSQTTQQARQKLREIWNSIGNREGDLAMEEGWAESRGLLQKALEVGGDQYLAHGMAKSRFSSSLRDLFDLFDNDIDSQRGGGRLYVAPLVLPSGINLGGATGTASGSAYTDGAFMLVAKHGRDGIRSLDDIGGILINSGLTDIKPEILDQMKLAFPDLVIGDYRGVEDFVIRMHQSHRK